MYCGKCGTKNEDGAAFCKECGEQLTGAAPQAAASALEKETHYRKIGIAAVAVIAVVIVAVFFLFSGPKPYEKPLKQMINGINSQDATAIVESMLPQKGIQYLEEHYSGTTDGMQKDLTRSFAGQEVQISYKLEKVSDALESDSDNSFLSDLETIGIEVTDQKRLTIQLSGKQNGIEASLPGSLIVYKADGKWYVDPISLENMFSGLF